MTSEAPAVDTSKTTIGTTATLDTHPEASARTELRRPIASTVAGHGHGRVRERHGLRRDGPRERVHHRRRQHDGREDGHAGQAAQQRVHPGGRGQDRRLRGRVRPSPRRHDQRRHEVRRKRVPGRRVRLLRFRVSRLERQAHGRPERREPGRVLLAEAPRCRRGPRRLLREGPALVLRRPTTASTRTRTTHARSAVLRDAAQTKIQTANTDTYRNDLYSGKLTLRLGESNTIAASIFGDPGTFSGRYDLTQISVMIGADGAWLVDRNVGGSDFSATLGRPLRHAVPRAGAGRLPHGETRRTRARSPARPTSRSSRRVSRRRRSRAPARSSSRTRSTSATSTRPPGRSSWGRTRSRPASTGST